MSKTFWHRLLWRDLAYWQLYHWPTMPTEPIRRPYLDQEWSEGPEAKAALRAWQKGQTGFPLVDAGMRELWQTGWMHQNVRMFCASFLVEVRGGRAWERGAVLGCNGRQVGLRPAAVGLQCPDGASLSYQRLARQLICHR